MYRPEGQEDTPELVQRNALARRLGGSSPARRATVRERLDKIDAVATTHMAQVKRAKEIFDAHPELEELLDLLRQIGV